MGGRLDPAVAAVRVAVRAELGRLVETACPDGPGTAGAATGSAESPLVLAACSGGADSTALAAALAFEAPRCGVRAGAVTIDHRLQPGSGERAARVAELLAVLGLAPVRVLPVTVPTGAGTGGVEAAARQARYAALTSGARADGAAAVLLGHTRDDQAETVLLGLARGSGARSLAGMRTVTGVFRRPLLGLTRQTTRAACAAAGLPVWDDPHNEQDRFARARVRHRVLPVLETELGPGVAAALARTADLLREDADALDALAAARLAELAGRGGPRQADSSAAPVDDLPVPGLLATVPAVRSRVLRHWLLAAGAPATDLTYGHVAAVRELVEHWHGQGAVDIPGELSVHRHGRPEQARLCCRPRRQPGVAG